MIFQPRAGYLLVEPAWEAAQNTIFDPRRERFPSVGWVVAKGETRERFEINDLVIVPVYAVDTPHGYVRLLHLRLLDDEALLRPEYEPHLRELIFRARATGEHVMIRLQDVEDRDIEFYSRDVLDMEIVDHTTYAVRSRYPQKVSMVWLDTKLFYIVHENDIPAILD